MQDSVNRGVSLRARRTLAPAEFAVAIQKYRRATWVLVGVLALLEAIVFVSLSHFVGLLLFSCTGGIAIATGRIQWMSGLVRDQREHEEKERSQQAFYRDDETGLPNRQNLIETLGRDISRSVRRSEELTLAVIRVARLDDLRAAWGKDAAPMAIAHVSTTLLRIARNSDFLARIDEDRFAMLLVGCDEQQAGLFADRAVLAVANRPLEARGRMKVPVYVSIEVTALQYDAEKYRGPLEFLSAAGGDVAAERRTNPFGQPAARPERTRTAAAEARVAAPRRASTNPFERSPRPAATSDGAARETPAPGRTADANSLRRQLLGNSYANTGRAADFAEAYQASRGKTRRAS